MSIVLSKGTLVNKILTSNEIILYPFGTFTFLIDLINSELFLTLYADVANGANNLAKYLAVLYVAVPIC